MDGAGAEYSALTQKVTPGQCPPIPSAAQQRVHQGCKSREAGGDLAEGDDANSKCTRALDVHHAKAPHQHDERASTISRSSKSGSSENSMGISVTTSR